MKKIILIVIIILIILSGALFVYAFFDSKNSDRTVTESIRNIFPQSESTGQQANSSNNTDSDPNQEQNNINNQNGFSPNTSSQRNDRLVKITSDPVAGGFFSSTSTIRYIDQGTGNIFEYQMFTENSRKITNTTIPQIYDSYWINKDTFVARYLGDNDETIKSFVGTINNAGNNGSVTTSFLPDNIKSIAINGNDVAYIYDNLVDANIGLYNVDTGESVILGKTPTPEMNIFWAGNILYTYPHSSNGVGGTLFSVDVSSGSLNYELGPINGMLAKGISNNEILISSHSSTNQTFLYDTATKETNPISTNVIPEKCTAGPSQTYCAGFLDISSNIPDSWYKGEVSFNDNMQLLVDTDFITDYIFPEKIDVLEPQISQDETSILFINKKDRSLWTLDINQN